MKMDEGNNVMKQEEEDRKEEVVEGRECQDIRKTKVSDNHAAASPAKSKSRPDSSMKKAAGATNNKCQLISEKCKMFNRLFHCSSGSEDSASSSDTVLEITKEPAPTTTNSDRISTVVAVNEPNSSTKLTKLTINPMTQYFNHDDSNSLFKPAATATSTSSGNSGSSRSRNHNSNTSTLNRNVNKPQTVSQFLSKTTPKNPSQVTVKVKQEPVEDLVHHVKNSGRNQPSQCDEVKIKVEPDLKSSKEEFAESSMNSPSTAAVAESASAVKMFSDVATTSKKEDRRAEGTEQEAETESTATAQTETKKSTSGAKRMDKESKQLLIELTNNEKRKSSRLVSKTTFCNKKHEAQIMKRLKVIIKKSPDDLTTEERQLKEAFPHLVRQVKKRLETRKLASERLKEFEDSPEELEAKCTRLAKVIKNSQYLVVYTGAGISTSASIPDYRGPNGIWTLLRNGQSLDGQSPTVLTTADPTLTHMALKKLHDERVVKHIVSQNCDGLHLRSGIPKNALSEVHGNMYVEVCTKCSLEYVRTFDVTENTRRYEHRTGRHCYFCGSELRDTVVHFGERGFLRWPLNWAGAEYNVARADVILCMGSSLKVLRRYPWLWGMDRPLNKRPKLYIVNLQWTPKDQFAALKIHGKCDEVMSKVMSKLNLPIPTYERETDQIFALATPLHESEASSKSAVELTFPPGKQWPVYPHDLNNYTKFEPKFIPHDLKIKKEEDELLSTAGELGSLSKSAAAARASRILRSQTKAKAEDHKKGKIKSPVKKKRERTGTPKGNGNGWFGNAWGKVPTKAKKRKITSTTTGTNSSSASVATTTSTPTMIMTDSSKLDSDINSLMKQEQES